MAKKIDKNLSLYLCNFGAGLDMIKQEIWKWRVELKQVLILLAMLFKFIFYEINSYCDNNNRCSNN